MDKIEFNKLSSNNFSYQSQDSSEQDQDIIHQSNWNASTSLKSIYQTEKVFVGPKFCLLDTPNPTLERWDATDLPPLQESRPEIHVLNFEEVGKLYLEAIFVFPGFFLLGVVVS